MSRLLCRCASLAMLFSAPLALGASPGAPPASTLGISSSPGAVPFVLANGLLYIGGNVNGSPALSFVVDTAAAATSLDPQVAQAAGVTAQSKVPVVLGGRLFPPQTLAFAPTAYITQISGHPTAGVVGQTQLSQYSLGVDFDRKRLALLSKDVCPASAVRLPVVFAGGLPFVEASIPLPDGQQAVGLFLIDTGQSDPGIVLAASFVAAHPGLAPQGKQQHTGGSTWVRLPELRLGKLRLAAPIAAVQSVSKGAENPRLAGVLGLSALSRFNFVLNEGYASLYLEPNSHNADRFEADMSGLVLRADGAKLTVAEVQPDSPAARAHVQDGDVLSAVENKPVAAANLGSVQQALRSVPGATVHLALLRHGQPVHAALQLQRLL